MKWARAPRCHLHESRSRRWSEPAVMLRRSIRQICTAFSFSFLWTRGEEKNSRVQLSGCKRLLFFLLYGRCSGSIAFTFISILFVPVPADLNQPATCFSPCCYGNWRGVAWPFCKRQQPCIGNHLAESKRSELALGLTWNKIYTLALGMYHI